MMTAIERAIPTIHLPRKTTPFLQQLAGVAAGSQSPAGTAHGVVKVLKRTDLP